MYYQCDAYIPMNLNKKACPLTAGILLFTILDVYIFSYSVYALITDYADIISSCILCVAGSIGIIFLIYYYFTFFTNRLHKDTAYVNITNHTITVECDGCIHKFKISDIKKIKIRYRLLLKIERNDGYSYHSNSAYIIQWGICPKNISIRGLNTNGNKESVNIYLCKKEPKEKQKMMHFGNKMFHFVREVKRSK